MGFGFVFMLLVIGLPLAGIIAMVVWLVNTNKVGNPFSANPPSGKQEQVEGQRMKRTCSHCGAGLQDGWTHCPQCGAPVES